SNSSSTTADYQRLFNSTKRLAAYVIKHPDYYNFDTENANNTGNETNGILGVPLYADTDLWYCTYSSSGSPSCDSLDYCGSSSCRYSEISNNENERALALYDITATQKHSALGSSGGMIRWDNDGLYPWSYDVFDGISCAY